MAATAGDRQSRRCGRSCTTRSVGVASVLLGLALAFALAPAVEARTGGGIGASDTSPVTAPTSELAARLFSVAVADVVVERSGEAPPVWIVKSGQETLGYIASTWEIAGSVGYSGRPIEMLVGISHAARIVGATLVRHNEPILTLGISTEDVARYVQGFAGYDLSRTKVEAFKDSAGLPPIIAGATVTTGVIRDGILRTARTVAIGHKLITTAAADIDRTGFVEKTWRALVSDGSVAHARMSLGEAARRFGPVRDPVGDGDAPFLDVFAAIIDPPTIGRNLLGQHSFTQAAGALGAGDAALLVASNGVGSHRGTSYRETGVFDRIEVIQGERTIKLKAADFLRIDKLAAKDVPEFKEISVFRVEGASGFRASAPFRIEISAEREREDGSASSIRLPVAYALPRAYVVVRGDGGAATAEDPLWVSAWQRKPLTIAFVGLMIAWVAGAFFVQEFFVARPRLWEWGRMGFLAVSLVLLGWVAKGQLSVVQVVAFLHSIMNGFRWETFLIEPVIFILWGFVGLGLLFWGRGVYCGWLCPFGALQELLNEGAKRLGVKQIEVPFWLHERLWVLKYTLFVSILALSFYSMEKALILAEVEPFKTAISMRFWRAWPFVAFVLALLAAGLFIERFYCRYLCPLGAALAIPAKLKLFDWLHRRPQCGRECRFCETQCTVGAIDPLGRINPNECILCLRCQVIMNDEAQCVTLKRRAGRRGGDAPQAAPPA